MLLGWIGWATLMARLAVAAVPSPLECEKLLATSQIKRGYLFSAITLAHTPLAARWAALRGEAQDLFPNLKLKKRADLHFTIAYLGGDWNLANLERLQAHALVSPMRANTLMPKVARMGRNQQVVALEFEDTDPAWSQAVIAAKAELVRLGLRKAEIFDATFRVHATFAEARNFTPSTEEDAELARFQQWLTDRLGPTWSQWAVTLEAGHPVQLLLAGAERPKGAPDYLTLDEFLELHLSVPGALPPRPSRPLP